MDMLLKARGSKLTAFTLLAASLTLLTTAGCEQSDGSASPYGPPWITRQEDELGFSSIGNVINEDGSYSRRFRAGNKEFIDLLANICSEYEVSIVVRPQELVRRGIEIEVIGADAGEVLGNLAKECNLQLEQVDDSTWRLALEGSEGEPEETVTMDSY